MVHPSFPTKLATTFNRHVVFVSDFFGQTLCFIFIHISEGHSHTTESTGVSVVFIVSIGRGHRTYPSAIFVGVGYSSYRTHACDMAIGHIPLTCPSDRTCSSASSMQVQLRRHQDWTSASTPRRFLSSGFSHLYNSLLPPRKV